jgi:hypothetical protein
MAVGQKVASPQPVMRPDATDRLISYSYADVSSSEKKSLSVPGSWNARASQLASSPRVSGSFGQKRSTPHPLVRPI